MCVEAEGCHCAMGNFRGACPNNRAKKAPHQSIFVWIRVKPSRLFPGFHSKELETHGAV